MKFINKKISKITVVWLAAWFTTVGFVMYFLKPLGVDYFNYFYITAAFFSVSGLLGIYLSNVRSLEIHHKPLRQQLLWALLFTILIIGIGMAIDRYYPLTAEKSQSVIDSSLVFPLFKFSTWVAKVCDVLFQQIYIFIFLILVQRQGLNKRETISLFSIVFALLHLPLVFSLKWAGLYFILPSLVAGTMFSYLILFFSSGLFLSYGLHLLFYFYLGIYLRYGF